MSKVGKLVCALGLLVCMGRALGEDYEALQGRWSGPWYIGMSSGIAIAEIRENGGGSIALTNLEGFGDSPVALGKQEFDGKNFRFSAVGANGTEFWVKLQVSADGAKMLGNGKYGGFGARMELQKAR
jgi:hypothetical protein